MEKIQVVLCEPGQAARRAEVELNVKALQRTVGGTFQATYPFDDNVCLVCDDDGKYDGALPNRILYDKEGNIQDIIYGPFFICGKGEEDFCSLSEEQIETYLKIFEVPDCLVLDGRVILICVE